jgi:hypothetical protein
VRWIGGGGALNEFVGKIVSAVRSTSTAPPEEFTEPTRTH